MKEDVIPAAADRPLFLLAPGLAVFSALATFAVIPYGANLKISGREIPLLGADVLDRRSLHLRDDVAFRLCHRARGLVLEQQVLAHGRDPLERPAHLV
jgi:hypothetical protein